MFKRKENETKGEKKPGSRQGCGVIITVVLTGALLFWQRSAAFFCHLSLFFSSVLFLCHCSRWDGFN